MTIRPEAAPDALAALFGRHPAVHPYGLADLEEPFWSESRWYLRDEAAVGVLELAGASVAIVYAVSATAPEATTALVVELAAAGRLPAHAFFTGPVGVADALAPWFDTRWCSPHTRMRLAGSPGPAVPDAVTVGPDDAPRVEALFAAAPDPARFFTASMLESGAYVARAAADGSLVALAGVHVLSRRYRVAAIGNVVTHPDHRRRGHAAALVRTLCVRLATEVDVIGLNVSDDNVGARALYDGLGFEPVIPFDEGELVARTAAAGVA